MKRAEAVRTLRKETLKLTVKDFGDLLGVSDAAVCKWEAGDGIHVYNLGKLRDLAVEKAAPQEVVESFTAAISESEARA